MSDREWIIKSAVVSEDGKSMEVSFKTTKGISTHTTTNSSEAWLAGCFAEFKLAEFQEKLKEAVQILEGRR